MVREKHNKLQDNKSQHKTIPGQDQPQDKKESERFPLANRQTERQVGRQSEDGRDTQ
jgi:hypothetical protein